MTAPFRLPALLLVLSFPAIGAEPDDDGANADAKSVLGTWRFTSVSYDGGLQDVSGKMTFGADHKLAADVGGQEGTFEYALDPTKKPKWIDLKTSDFNIAGIYSLEGDTLKICHGDPKSPRPSEFKTEKGDRISLVTLTRAADDGDSPADSPASNVLTIDELTELCINRPEEVSERYAQHTFEVQGVVEDIQPNCPAYFGFEKRMGFDHQLTLECNTFVPRRSSSLPGKPMTVICHCHNYDDEDIQPASRQTFAGITVGQTVTIRGKLWYNGPDRDKIEFSGTFIVASEPPPEDAPPAEELMTMEKVQEFFPVMNPGALEVLAFNKVRQDPPLVTEKGTILPGTLEKIRKLPVIDELQCHEVLSAGGIRQLATLTTLRELALNDKIGDDVTAADFAQLMTLPKLRRLTITNVPAQFLADTQRFPPLLREMSWERPRPDEPLSALQGLESLRDLRITEVTDDDLSALNSLRHLRWLTIVARSEGLSGVGLEALADSPDLISLTLYSHDLTPEGVRAIGQLTNLRQLRFINSWSRDSSTNQLGDLSFLAELPDLQMLAIIGGELEHGYGEHLAALAKLHTLTIQDVTLDAKEFAAFATTPKPNLAFLELRNTGIGDAEIGALFQQPLTRLRYLELNQTAIGDASLAAIGKAAPPNLQSLDVGKTAVTDAGIAHLKALPNLYSVDTYGTAVSNEALKELYDRK